MDQVSSSAKFPPHGLFSKRFSTRQKALILIFVVYLVCAARQQVLQVLDIASRRTDLSSLIRNEQNLTRLKQINEEVQAKLKDLQPKETVHEIKAEIGVEHQHMVVPAGRPEIDTHVEAHVDKQNFDDNLQIMEDAIEKVKQEQSRRGSVAGTVVVMGYFTFLSITVMVKRQN